MRPTLPTSRASGKTRACVGCGGVFGTTPERGQKVGFPKPRPHRRRGSKVAVRCRPEGPEDENGAGQWQRRRCQRNSPVIVTMHGAQKTKIAHFEEKGGTKHNTLTPPGVCWALPDRQARFRYEYSEPFLPSSPPLRPLVEPSQLRG